MLRSLGRLLGNIIYKVTWVTLFIIWTAPLTIIGILLLVLVPPLGILLLGWAVMPLLILMNAKHNHTNTDKNDKEQ